MTSYAGSLSDPAIRDSMAEPVFSEECIAEILNKKRTSPGFSRVGYDALACADSWRVSLITLFKKTSSIPSVDQFRPIACQEADYKAFTTCIKEAMLKHCDKHKIIDPLQMGFKRGASTAKALLTLKGIIADSHRTNRDLYVMHLDLRKAYDSVEIWALLKTLEHYGFGEHLRAGVFKRQDWCLQRGATGGRPVPPTILVVHQPSTHQH